MMNMLCSRFSSLGSPQRAHLIRVNAVPLTSHTATGPGRMVASLRSQPHGGRAFTRHTRPDPRRYGTPPRRCPTPSIRAICTPWVRPGGVIRRSSQSRPTCLVLFALAAELSSASRIHTTAGDRRRPEVLRRLQFESHYVPKAPNWMVLAAGFLDPRSRRGSSLPPHAPCARRVGLLVLASRSLSASAAVLADPGGARRSLRPMSSDRHLSLTFHSGQNAFAVDRKFRNA